MTQMGVRSGLSLFLTSLFMVSPIILEYENWLSYGICPANPSGKDSNLM
jgi:hypothetical protein